MKTLLDVQNPWEYKNNAGTQQTDTEIKAAPGANAAIYLTYLLISTDTILNIELEDEDGNDIIPPLYFAALGGVNGGIIYPPLELPANKALTYSTSGAGNVTIVASGYIDRPR